MVMLATRAIQGVAPLAGSVDRNQQYNGFVILTVVVAPLAGSVDRNRYGLATMMRPVCVAPLAGSVDRNNEVHQFENYDNVAPLAGSVDRNELFLSPAL